MLRNAFTKWGNTSKIWEWLCSFSFLDSANHYWALNFNPWICYHATNYNLVHYYFFGLHITEEPIYISLNNKKFSCVCSKKFAATQAEQLPRINNQLELPSLLPPFLARSFYCHAHNRVAVLPGIIAAFQVERKWKGQESRKQKRLTSPFGRYAASKNFWSHWPELCHMASSSYKGSRRSDF